MHDHRSVGAPCVELIAINFREGYERFVSRRIARLTRVRIAIAHANPAPFRDELAIAVVATAWLRRADAVQAQALHGDFCPDTRPNRNRNSMSVEGWGARAKGLTLAVNWLPQTTHGTVLA